MAYSTTATAFFFTLVAVASAMPKNGTIFKCTSEGRFPDPFDCTSYVTCVAKSDGSLVRSKGDCKGHAYHPDLRTCVDPSKVPGCNSRKPKQLMSDPTLSSVCTESAFVCGDCKTVVNCIGTKGYKDSTCSAGYSCSIAGSGALAGTAACLPNDRADEGCLCTDADLNKPKQDPNSDTSFIFCPPDGGDSQVHKCPQGLLYDEAESQCQSADGSPICTAPGTYTNADCSGTYSCLQTSDGFVRSTLTCDEGTLVAPKEGVCTDPCTWPKKDHECVQEGRFKVATDCSKFVVCVELADGSGGFEKTIRHCPPGYVWDETAAGNKGHCVGEYLLDCDVLPDHSCPVDDFPCNGASFRSQPPDETENTIQNVIQLLQEGQQ